MNSRDYSHSEIACNTCTETNERPAKYSTFRAATNFLRRYLIGVLVKNLDISRRDEFFAMIPNWGTRQKFEHFAPRPYGVQIGFLR